MNYPREWNIKASYDGIEWVVVDHRTRTCHYNDINREMFNEFQLTYSGLYISNFEFSSPNFTNYIEYNHSLSIVYF